MVPRSRAADRRFFGVAPAVVVAVNDAGEVRLQFPWLDPNMTTEQYCRVAHNYAGNGYGTFFTPEVGDEVLVGFVHGTLETPVVLSGLYNGVDKAAADRSGGKDHKLIRTKAGHEIRFIDTGGDGKVVIQDKSAKAVIELPSSGPQLTIRADGGTITVHGKSVTVQADAALELKGQSVSISATGGDVTVSGSKIFLN